MVVWGSGSAKSSGETRNNFWNLWKFNQAVANSPPLSGLVFKQWFDPFRNGFPSSENP